MSSFAFPATFTPDETGGGFTVTFRDLPEAITQGDTRDQCLLEAADCLEEATPTQIGDNLDISIPSKAQSGEFTICVPLTTALKAALYSCKSTEHSPSKSILCARLTAEVKVLRWCKDLLKRLERGEDVVINLRPEEDVKTDSTAFGPARALLLFHNLYHER